MCITATTSAPSGTTFLVHLDGDSASLVLDGKEALALLSFIDDPKAHVGTATVLRAKGAFPLAQSCRQGSKNATVTGMTVFCSPTGYDLHANLDQDYHGRDDGQTPLLYTVPAETLREMLAATLDKRCLSDVLGAEQLRLYTEAIEEANSVYRLTDWSADENYIEFTRLVEYIDPYDETTWFAVEHQGPVEELTGYRDYDSADKAYETFVRELHDTGYPCEGETDVDGIEVTSPGDDCY
ncbi:hypothetical protein BJ973_003992 [Actinoplanes tereljensis]|uniref:Uncharacterized protein n=1 Tax=Paractinoplanes tereljensis TaxID=571912 RepID=A0A919TYX7_9ACTN|nr:hypothetical protein [Actinoplanes tereljensis]GIF25715.1 hypothetical protein Ate02nite_84450 [Actinoplanes tereljensis]